MVFLRYLAMVATAHTPTAATAPITLCPERTMECPIRQGPAGTSQHHALQYLVGSAQNTHQGATSCVQDVSLFLESALLRSMSRQTKAFTAACPRLEGLEGAGRRATADH